MLSERLRNLEPRLRRSKAFFSSDFRLDHSNDTPITIPVKKTNANLNQRCWPSARRLLKTVEAIGLGKTVVAIPLESKMFSSNHLSRMGMISGISRRPQIPNRNCLSHLDIASYVRYVEWNGLSAKCIATSQFDPKRTPSNSHCHSSHYGFHDACV